MSEGRIDELARRVLDLATRRYPDLTMLRDATADLQVAIAEAAREERIRRTATLPKQRASR